MTGSSDPTSVATLREELRALGVRPGDALMVHASMRRVGSRAETLLDALEQAVGPTGTLLMLVCAPEGPFDPETSPAWPELGVLSEAFRVRPGVVLNAHPVARMAAWGAGDDTLVGNPPLDDYYGPGSPLARLVEAGGRVLRLGADRDTVTLLHLAEYLAEVPDKRRRSWRVDVVGSDSIESVCGSCLDDALGIRDWKDGEDYFAQILLEYLEAGHGAVGRVGGADSELLDAPHALRFAVRWMERAFRVEEGNPSSG